MHIPLPGEFLMTCNFSQLRTKLANKKMKSIQLLTKALKAGLWADISYTQHPGRSYRLHPVSGVLKYGKRTKM